MMMDNGIRNANYFWRWKPATKWRLVLVNYLSAGKRLLVGESLFMTAFTNTGSGKKKVSFASPYHGKNNFLDLQQLGGKIICSKRCFFVCSERRKHWH
jgi:uncharacterized protein (AIM24 family)